MDSLLQTVALYRKKDPAMMDEEECMENLFQCVCTTLLLPGESMVVSQWLYIPFSTYFPILMIFSVYCILFSPISPL